MGYYDSFARRRDSKPKVPILGVKRRMVPSVVCVVIRTHAPSRLRYILRGERAKLRPRLGVQGVFLCNSTGGP